MAVYGSPLGNGLGVERQALIDRALLTNITERTVFEKYATITKPLPLKNSKIIQFEKWIRMKDLMFADNLNQQFTGNDVNVGEETLLYMPDNAYEDFVLDEGSSGTSKGRMKLIRTEATVFPIGDWMPYTEELEMFHNRWSVQEAVKQMGDVAASVIDGFYRETFRNGAGHLVDITGAGSGNDNIVDAAFGKASRKIMNQLKLSGAKPVNQILTSSVNVGTKPVWAKFIGMIHTIAGSELRNNPLFVPIEEYAAGLKGGPLEGEIGILDQSIRIIEHENAPLKSLGGSDYEVEMLIFGNDHTAHVPIRGKGSVNFIYQPIGSGGTSDPLKRVGTCGWKSWLGVKTLYAERLGKVVAKMTYA